MFSELICTCDSREKDKKRIDTIQSFIEQHGGVFQIECLGESANRKESLDYYFEGIFNNQEIDLAIEYKSLPDLINTWDVLEDRLARAILAHKHVSLAFEFVSPDLINLETIDCKVKHPDAIKYQSLRDGRADTFNISILEAKIEEWTRQGVHVRQISNTNQATTTILNLLYFCTKENHGGLWLKDQSYNAQFINWLAYLPIEGFGFKTAQKIAEQYKNAHWLSTVSEEDLKDNIGDVLGSRLYNFLHHQINPDICIVPTTPIKPKKKKEDKKEGIKPLDEVQTTSISHRGDSKDVPRTLEDHILEYVWEKPVKDTEIIDAFRFKGFKLEEIHNVLIEGKKLYKYKQGGCVMISHHQVKAEKELDIGV